VDLVVMFDFPKTGVEYLHRAGRTGRLGRRGRVISLVNDKESLIAERIEKAIKNGDSLETLTVENLIKEKIEKRREQQKIKHQHVTGKKRNPFAKDKRNDKLSPEAATAQKLSKIKKYLL
jgi:superfamily II DNA/RNA helicase